MNSQPTISMQGTLAPMSAADPGHAPGAKPAARPGQRQGATPRQRRLPDGGDAIAALLRTIDTSDLQRMFDQGGVTHIVQALALSPGKAQTGAIRPAHFAHMREMLRHNGVRLREHPNDIPLTLADILALTHLNRTQASAQVNLRVEVFADKCHALGIVHWPGRAIGGCARKQRIFAHLAHANPMELARAFEQSPQGLAEYIGLIELGMRRGEVRKLISRLRTMLRSLGIYAASAPDALFNPCRDHYKPKPRPWTPYTTEQPSQLRGAAPQSRGPGPHATPLPAQAAQTWQPCSPERASPPLLACTQEEADLLHAVLQAAEPERALKRPRCATPPPPGTRRSQRLAYPSAP